MSCGYDLDFDIDVWDDSVHHGGGLTNTHYPVARQIAPPPLPNRMPPSMTTPPNAPRSNKAKYILWCVGILFVLGVIAAILFWVSQRKSDTSSSSNGVGGVGGGGKASGSEGSESENPPSSVPIPSTVTLPKAHDIPDPIAAESISVTISATGEDRVNRAKLEKATQVTAPGATQGPPILPPGAAQGPPILPPGAAQGPPILPPGTAQGPPIIPLGTAEGLAIGKPPYSPLAPSAPRDSVNSIELVRQALEDMHLHNWGVLGHLGEVLPPREKTCIVDPAGLYVMQGKSLVSSAGPASRSIYEAFNIKEIPQAVQKYFASHTLPGGVIFQRYDNVGGLIHAVGPDSSDPMFSATLEQVYYDILLAYQGNFDQCRLELRLLPVSGGDRAPRNLKVADYTLDSIVAALMRLSRNNLIQYKMNIGIYIHEGTKSKKNEFEEFCAKLNALITALPNSTPIFQLPQKAPLPPIKDNTATSVPGVSQQGKQTSLYALWQAMQVYPYSIIGDPTVPNSAPKTGSCLMIPSGKEMMPQNNARAAGPSARAVLSHYHIDEIPDRVKTIFRDKNYAVGTALFVQYPSQGVNIIHVSGPPNNDANFYTALSDAYLNVFTAFLAHASDCTELRLLPLSGGHFSPSTQSVATYTIAAIAKAFETLDNAQKLGGIPIKRMGMYIHDGATAKKHEYDAFQNEITSTLHKYRNGSRDQSPSSSLRPPQSSPSTKPPPEKVIPQHIIPQSLPKKSPIPKAQPPQPQPQQQQVPIPKVSAVDNNDSVLMVIWKRMQIVPYGVLGRANDATTKPGAGQCIVDPAGLPFMQQGLQGAGGGSGAIYKYLQIYDSPPDVNTYFLGWKEAGGAIFHKYPTLGVIHAVGPSLPNKFLEQLTTTYINVIRAYQDSIAECGKELRILPISGGIFTPSNLKGKEAEFTMRCLFDALKHLANTKELRQDLNLQMHIFERILNHQAQVDDMIKHHKNLSS